MPSDDQMERLVITGGSSGLGRHIIEEALFTDAFPKGIINLDMKSFGHSRVTDRLVDLGNPGMTEAYLQGTEADVLINCAGINNVNWLEDLDFLEFDRVMNVNARAIFLTVKALLPALTKNRGTVLNIVSNASHTPMTASLAYNASKGAAHIMTLQLARELTKTRGITVFGISPAKIKGTEMSGYIEERVTKVRGWSPEEAKEYQSQGLVTGSEIDPAVLAELIVYLLRVKKRHYHLSGCVMPYGL